MQIVSIPMKCQILFSGENKQNIINMSPVEFVRSAVKVKDIFSIDYNVFGNAYLKITNALKLKLELYENR